MSTYIIKGMYVEKLENNYFETEEYDAMHFH
jgi:hypothetical protein